MYVTHTGQKVYESVQKVIKVLDTLRQLHFLIYHRISLLLRRDMDRVLAVL